MAGRGKQRTTFGKRERERKRQEKQAAKRARRHHDGVQPPEVADLSGAEQPELVPSDSRAGSEADD